MRPARSRMRNASNSGKSERNFSPTSAAASIGDGCARAFCIGCVHPGLGQVPAHWPREVPRRSRCSRVCLGGPRAGFASLQAWLHARPGLHYLHPPMEINRADAGGRRCARLSFLGPSIEPGEHRAGRDPFTSREVAPQVYLRSQVGGRWAGPGAHVRILFAPTSDGTRRGMHPSADVSRCAEAKMKTLMTKISYVSVRIQSYVNVS